MISVLLCIAAVSSAPSFGEANNLPIEKRVYWEQATQGEPLPKWESALPISVGEQTPYLVTNEYGRREASTTIVLVHDRGMSSAIWDHPAGGLAPYLWGEGHRVVTIEGFGTRNGYQPSAYTDEVASVEDALWKRLTLQIAKKYPKSSLILLGHGYGGRRIYEQALQLPQVDGAVALNIPLSLGGSSKALKRALSEVRQGKSKWSILRKLPFVPQHAKAKQLGDLLLSRSISPETWQYFDEMVEAPLHLSGIVHRMKNEISFPVPVENNLVRLIRARWEKPILLLLASHDGWVPPWQCDPAVFGIKKPSMTRQFLTRANGDAMEYNHLDVVSHPQAENDVFPRIADWLEQFER